MQGTGFRKLVEANRLGGKKHNLLSENWNFCTVSTLQCSSQFEQLVVTPLIFAVVKIFNCN
jgi:hypothetical protein